MDQQKRQSEPPAPPGRPLDEDVQAAATHVMEGALGVVAGERVVVIVDGPRERLGGALALAAGACRAQATLLNIDDFGVRPLAALPAQIGEALAGAQASVFLARQEPREIGMRKELIELVRRHELRHAHMVGVSRVVMTEGLAVDPQRTAHVARVLRAQLRPNSVVRVRSAAGSELEITCHPQHRWIENSGRIRPGHWENLPAGELLSAPGAAQGVYVVTASATPIDGIDTGMLLTTPIRLEIEDGRVRRVECCVDPLQQAVERFMHSGENLDRIGLFGFGTNVGLEAPTGYIMADQTLPGLYIALGLTYPELTGASWNASAQLVLTSMGADIDIDDKPVMRAGRYLEL